MNSFLFQLMSIIGSLNVVLEFVIKIMLVIFIPILINYIYKQTKGRKQN
ncbi:hypothetical protein [Senegalia sp. (in: firmicutes)]